MGNREGTLPGASGQKKISSPFEGLMEELFRLLTAQSCLATEKGGD